MERTALLADENSKWLSLYSDLFHAAGLSLTKVGDPDAPPDGSSDDEIFEHCVSQSTSLITENGDDFKKILKAPENERRAKEAQVIVFVISQKGANDRRAGAICKAICESLATTDHVQKVYVSLSRKIHEMMNEQHSR